MARAIITDPRLIFADEPTGALDSKTAGELLTLLEQINQRYKTTIFMVTHNEEIRKMAHKTIYLKDGMIFRTEECDQPISAVQLCL